MEGRMWDLADLVGPSEIAHLYATTRSTVSMWMARYEDFPAELIRIGGRPVYSKRQVVAWHRRQWPSGKWHRR